MMSHTAGSLPQASTTLTLHDRVVAISARLNIRRMGRTVPVGLYRVGNPSPDSPVLVTANYRLSFDAVRSVLTGRDIWLLVVDINGINVWCAAGKDLFTSLSVSRHIIESGLATVVSHRRLIFPQLGATGVAAHEVKGYTGFGVVWGPVRAADIPAFLDADMQATPAMRAVTFGLRERLAITGVELSRGWRPVYLAVLAVVALLGSLGAWGFSTQALLSRGGVTIAAAYVGLIAGALVTPVLLPWMPFRAFSANGALAGAVFGGLLIWAAAPLVGPLAALAAAFASIAISSAAAMDLTGATPVTSPSGVLLEMRRAMPWQVAGAVVAIALWTASAFFGGVS
ncbi:MAG: mercury methylation corrinoid protein HgcA [Coriobacteriia bacterium]